MTQYTKTREGTPVSRDDIMSFAGGGDIEFIRAKLRSGKTVELDARRWDQIKWKDSEK